MFECEDDESCQGPEGQGTCQPDGYCSFPDDTCPSGQRYGQHAGGGNQGTCVPVDDVASGTDGTTTSGMPTTSSTTSGGTTSTTMPTGTDPAPSSTTMPVGDTSTAATDSGGTTADPNTSGTTGPQPSCTIDDEFDGPSLDTNVWESWAHPGISVEQTNGVVQINLSPNDTGMGGIRTYPGDLNDTDVTMTIGTPPSDSNVEQSLVLTDDDGNIYRIVVTGNVVQVIWWDGTNNNVLYGEGDDVSPGDRFRFVFDTEAHVQMWTPQLDWQELWSGPIPLDLTDPELGARANTYQAIPNPGSPSFEAVSVCEH